MSNNTYIPILPNIQGTARVIPQHESYPPLTPEYDNPKVSKVELVTSDSYNKYLIMCVALVLVVLVVAVAYMATKNTWYKKDTPFIKMFPQQQGGGGGGKSSSVPNIQQTPVKTNTVPNKPVNPTKVTSVPDDNISVDNSDEESKVDTVKSRVEEESDEEDYINLKSKKEKAIIDEVNVVSAMVNTDRIDSEDIQVTIPKYVREEAAKYEDADVKILTSEKLSISQINKLIGEYNNTQFNKWINNKTMQKLLNK